MAQAKKAPAKNSRKQPAKPSSRASVKTYNNYIGGKWVPSESGEVFENINPADSEDVIGRFQLSTSDDVNDAVNAAQSAFDGWRHLPAPKRAEILFRLGEILIRNKDRFMPGLEKAPAGEYLTDRLSDETIQALLVTGGIESAAPAPRSPPAGWSIPRARGGGAGGIGGAVARRGQEVVVQAG